MTLERRVALITGSGGEGMGRSIALTLARDGADIVLNYRRDPARAEATAGAIRDMGRRVIAVQADVSEPAEVSALVGAARAQLGAVDVVVASAGGPWKPQDVTEISPEHLRRVLAAEVEGVYALLRETLPAMREGRYGRIVLVGGHDADDWRFGPPEAPLDYPLGKAARHWIVRTLGPREFALGVTINAVAPGPTPRFTHDEALAALESAAASASPQRVADAVAFLCSEAGSRITGAVIPLPGDTPV